MVSEGIVKVLSHEPCFPFVMGVSKIKLANVPVNVCKFANGLSTVKVSPFPAIPTILIIADEVLSDLFQEDENT